MRTFATALGAALIVGTTSFSMSDANAEFWSGDGNQYGSGYGSGRGDFVGDGSGEGEAEFGMDFKGRGRTDGDFRGNADTDWRGDAYGYESNPYWGGYGPYGGAPYGGAPYGIAHCMQLG